MTNLNNDLNLVRVIEQIKQLDENVVIEIIDNVITVTNCNSDYISYLLLLFGKVVVK